MTEKKISVETREELKDFVYETLCQHEELEPGAFPMTEQVLTRSGKECGVYFCLNGPRSVRCTSIWESNGNKILFYGANGERFQTVYLDGTPGPECDFDNAHGA